MNVKIHERTGTTTLWSLFALYDPIICQNAINWVWEMFLHKYPSVNLLATCRTFYAEAYSIAYTKNHFFLPFGEYTSQFFANALHNPLRRSWIKPVALAFTQFDLSDEERMRLKKMRNQLVNKASHLSLRSMLLKEKGVTAQREVNTISPEDKPGEGGQRSPQSLRSSETL